MANPASTDSAGPRGPGQIGLVACVAFGVGTTVGGGVFTLSGTALNLAGPGAALSYILAATVLVTALNLGPTSLVARAETWIVGIKLAKVPRSIMLTTLVSAAVYLGTVLAMSASGITSFSATGVSQAAEIVMGAWGGLLAAFAACLSTLSGAKANVLGASEIMLRMVARGDVPPALGRHTSHGHPYVSVLLLGVITVLLVVLRDTTFVVSVANVAAIIAMIVVSAAAAVLGFRKWPGEGARLPLGPVIPLLAVLAAASPSTRR
ncbi:amino acid permease [Arthrobacter sp. Edens01]|uniref:amino acid permease n=1 Tax=Arthrobacter sp. Edens01 TaxID=1732020 RepID=UPI0006DB1CBF|nr:amino acid permease [Arthrobacter sp. Edens01]KPN18673.1 hypothetical protein AO716_12885 [Arthrobacter sp. Edens01]